MNENIDTNSHGEHNYIEGGFTGINFEDVYNQEMRMVTTVEEMFTGLTKDLSAFFRSLRKNWASENASNFSKEIFSLSEAYFKNIGTYADRIFNDINDSIRAYANSLGTGCTTHATNFSSIQLSENDFILDTKNINGVSGMNVKLVEDLLNYELPKISGNAINKMASLAQSISIYDENGEQQAIFETRRQAMKTLIYELLNTIESQIRSYVETEKNTILLAKQQTVQNMSGSSSTNA